MQPPKGGLNQIGGPRPRAGADRPMGIKARMIRRALRSGQPALQVAALPWRRTRGRTEILLVTSRRTRRLIIPKGWPMAGCTPARAAEIEAMEEAGAYGTAGPVPLGFYRYDKLLDTPRSTLWLPVQLPVQVPVQVTVFPLRVRLLLPQWKEAAERDRLWIRAGEARSIIGDPGLAALVARL